MSLVFPRSFTEILDVEELNRSVFLTEQRDSTEYRAKIYQSILGLPVQFGSIRDQVWCIVGYKNDPDSYKIDASACLSLRQHQKVIYLCFLGVRDSCRKLGFATRIISTALLLGLQQPSLGFSEVIISCHDALTAFYSRLGFFPLSKGFPFLSQRKGAENLHYYGLPIPICPDVVLMVTKEGDEYQIRCLESLPPNASQQFVRLASTCLSLTGDSYFLPENWVENFSVDTQKSMLMIHSAFVSLSVYKITPPSVRFVYVHKDVPDISTAVTYVSLAVKGACYDSKVINVAVEGVSIRERPSAPTLPDVESLLSQNQHPDSRRRTSGYSGPSQRRRT
ncbi:hypothetical protein RCL1_003565 [Eukaryota sp. TZLM3-RCL]